MACSSLAKTWAAAHTPEQTSSRADAPDPATLGLFRAINENASHLETHFRRRDMRSRVYRPFVGIVAAPSGISEAGEAIFTENPPDCNYSKG